MKNRRWHRNPVGLRGSLKAANSRQVAKAKALVAETLATYISNKGDIYYRHLARLGYSDISNQIRDAWASGGVKLAAQVVPPELQQSIGLVTASIEEARDRIAEEKAAGVDIHVVEVQAESTRDLDKALEAILA